MSNNDILDTTEMLPAPLTRRLELQTKVPEDFRMLNRRLNSVSRCEIWMPTLLTVGYRLPVKHSRGLLGDCEIFVNLRLKLYRRHQTRIIAADTKYLKVFPVVLHQVSTLHRKRTLTWRLELRKTCNIMSFYIYH